jgi:hypothetical protein
MWNALVGGVLGALLTYFLDPQAGRRRRNRVRHQIGTAARRGWKGLAGLAGSGRTAGPGGPGTAPGLEPPDEDPLATPNDATLANKVRSVVGADPRVPKGRINVNAEGGVIVLRGELDQPGQVAAIEERARGVPGVRDVRNLVRLPDEPPPRG